jgi:hypothetical protein
MGNSVHAVGSGAIGIIRAEALSPNSLPGRSRSYAVKSISAGGILTTDASGCAPSRDTRYTKTSGNRARAEASGGIPFYDCVRDIAARRGNLPVQPKRSATGHRRSAHTEVRRRRA